MYYLCAQITKSRKYTKPKFRAEESERKFRAEESKRKNQIKVPYIFPPQFVQRKAKETLKRPGTDRE